MGYEGKGTRRGGQVSKEGSGERMLRVSGQQALFNNLMLTHSGLSQQNIND